MALPNTEEIAGYVADFREFLQEGTFPERKALIRNFVEGIEVVGHEATLTYTVPMPNDGVTQESASVEIQAGGVVEGCYADSLGGRATSLREATAPLRFDNRSGCEKAPAISLSIPNLAHLCWIVSIAALC